MKAPSPLLGFNNNVKHKGRVFHIQTEDSGIKHPHVITHLFVDGGRILKSTKTSYAEFLEDEQMAVKVRQLMQEQHKAMFIALRAGKFDHLMEGESPAPSSDKVSDSAGRSGKIPAPPSSQVGSTTGVAEAEAKSEKKPDDGDGGPKSDASAKSDAAAAKSDVEAASAKPPAAAPRDKEPKDKEEPQPSSAQPASLRSAQIASQAAIPRVRPPTAPPSRDGRGSSPPNPVSLRPPSLIPPPPRAPSPSMSSIQASAGQAAAGHLTLGDRKADPRAETEAAMPAADPRPRLNSPLELNLEALERSASERAQGPVSGSDHRDLPPPPAAVLGKKPASIDTSYRSIAPPGAHTSVAAATGPGRPPEPSGAARTPPPPPAASPGAHSSSQGNHPGGTFGAGPPMRPRTQPFGGISRPPTSERRSVTPQGARYAPSRPASIFGSARPQEGSSIFGEDLISEKSLDEVILSYLAEDLEGAKKG